jgi:hypothetical protein
MVYVTINEFKRLNKDNVFECVDCGNDFVQVSLRDPDVVDYHIPLIIESPSIDNLHYTEDYLSRRYSLNVESYHSKNLATGVYTINYTVDKFHLLIRVSELDFVYTRLVRFLSTKGVKKGYTEGEDIVSQKYIVIRNVMNWCKREGVCMTPEAIMACVRNDQFFTHPEGCDATLIDYEVTHHFVEDVEDAVKIVNYLDSVGLEAVIIPHRGSLYVAHTHGDVLSRDDWKHIDPVPFPHYGLFEAKGATGLEKHLF